jgi:hypothetical protein
MCLLHCCDLKDEGPQSKPSATYMNLSLPQQTCRAPSSCQMLILTECFLQPSISVYKCGHIKGSQQHYQEGANSCSHFSVVM